MDSSSISRRDFVRIAVSATVTATVASSRAQTAETRPNILLINTEDTGPTIGCYGDTQIRTPHLDQLASEGVRFANAYVTQASCSPSRSSILTGLYPHQNGQIGLAHYGYCRPPGLPNLPGELKKAGYRTGCIGKIHTSPEKEFPFDFKGIGHGQTRDIAKVEASFKEFLKGDETKPFFFYLNLYDAHAPLLDQVAGKPEKPLTEADVTPWPWLGAELDGVRKRVAGYYNCVARVDLAVGAVLGALAGAGHAEDTLVVFMGDHGPPFCRAKTTCYEAGIRIPLIFRWPGKCTPGAVSESLVSTVDLMPTFLKAAGARLPEHQAGVSVIPLLTGNSTGWRQTLCAEFATHGPEGFFPQRSIRDAQYKLIVSPLAEDRGNPMKSVDGCPGYKLSQTDACRDPEVKRMYETWVKPPKYELYDLVKDPAEQRNLASQEEYRPILDRLLNELHRWQAETEDPLATPEGLAALTRFQDDAVAGIRKRIADAKAALGKKKLTRQESHKLRQIKATYDVPAAAWFKPGK